VVTTARLAEKEGIAMRGHCIFGECRTMCSLAERDERRRFQATVAERGRSIGARYRGRFAEYDPTMR